MSRPDLEEAHLLLRKAREDADLVRKLADDNDIADAIIGFHSQQAVEKALKSVLAASGDDFPWTHDLKFLIERLSEIGAPLPSSMHEVRVLGPWAVEFRYGETIDDPLDRREAVALVEQAIGWATNQVGSETEGKTQRLTAKDIAAGIVRIPRASKGLFPAEQRPVGVVVRGADLGEVRWDPRMGPDKERSGVVGIGKEAAAELAEGEVLRITRIDTGIQLD